MRCLLDTCLLSELVKPEPEPAVLAWVSGCKEADLFVSALTIAELRRGVGRLPRSRQRAELAAWLEKLEAGFEDRVLPFTRETAAVWAGMVIQSEAQGRSMAAFDSIIAATALEHGLRLVTCNVRDFASAGVGLFNPLDSA